jgi:hypothetical protein
MEPILGPISDPKITKYKDMVTAGGTRVWNPYS